MLLRKQVYFCAIGTLLTLQWNRIVKASELFKYTPNDICQPNPDRMPELEASTSAKPCQLSFEEGLRKGHPDSLKRTGQIINSYGYSYKTYKTKTKDGYILTMYRIKGSPNLPKSQYSKQKPAVLLVHGLMMASDCWFFQPGSRNLPFKLADGGYEVWLGNARGTTYSLDHDTLVANEDLEYWNFSWHEMGVYDVPAFTDKVIEVSGNKKIFFVGHSMGTTQLFVSLAEVPEMNKKIHAGFMLAPQAYMGHLNNKARYLMTLIDTDEKFQHVNEKVRGRLQSSNDLRHLGFDIGQACDHSAFRCGACGNLIFSLFGYNARHMNYSALSLVYSKTPNTFPLKAMAHFAQITMSCTFRQYNYGSDRANMKVYHQNKPPNYNLRNIKAPLYFFQANRDNFVPPNDVNMTANELRPGVLKSHYVVPDEYFVHSDFVMAKDADVLVYDKILKTMRTYK